MRPRVIVAMLICQGWLAAAAAWAQTNWPPQPGDRISASVYPTRRAAAVAAGARAVEMTLATGIDGNSLKVVVRGNDETVVAHVRQQLELAFPGKVSQTDEDVPAAVGIRVQVDDNAVTVTTTPPSASPMPGHTDGLPLPEVVMPLPEGVAPPQPPEPRPAAAFVLPFVDKPWADGLPDFSVQDEQGRWIVVHADRPGVSAEEAETLARDRAIELVLPLVQSQLRKAGVSLQINEAALAELRGALESGDVVADRFVARYDRPYGPVWHGALKVDTSAPTLDALAESIVLAQQRAIWRVARAALISGVVVTALLAFYAVANAITRGFFTTRLRIATMVLAVAAVWIITRFT